MRVQHRMTPLCWGGASAAATPSSKTAGVAQHDDVLLGRSLGESAAAVGSRRLTFGEVMLPSEESRVLSRVQCNGLCLYLFIPPVAMVVVSAA